MSGDQQEEREDARWSRVYLAVVIYTTALIAGLWALSQMFR